jgi:hypothetical protein
MSPNDNYAHLDDPHLHTSQGPTIQLAATVRKHKPAGRESSALGNLNTMEEHEIDENCTWTEFPPGYPRFAAYIAHDEDRSTTIYRRFQRLAARNLLYLESELAELEAEQDCLDLESRCNPSLQVALSSWKHLNDLATEHNTDILLPTNQDQATNILVDPIQEQVTDIKAAAIQRRDLALKIRETLRSYRESRHSSLLNALPLTDIQHRRSPQTRKRHPGSEQTQSKTTRRYTTYTPPKIRSPADDSRSDGNTS